MRILAIDPGEKRIGVAICDPTGTIASPLTVLNISRAQSMLPPLLISPFRIRLE